MEKQQNACDLCSGCAGDYEDPDWTAWEEGRGLEDDPGESCEEPFRPATPESQEGR